MSVIDIKTLLREIIPPNNFKHRDGFNNAEILRKLTIEQRLDVESELINMLASEMDYLVIETLGNLKSFKAIPALYSILEEDINGMFKLIVCSSIFQINEDAAMASIAIAAFKTLEEPKDEYYVYGLLPAFYYLAKINTRDVRSFIKQYIGHSEYLISYNARRALALYGK